MSCRLALSLLLLLTACQSVADLTPDHPRVAPGVRMQDVVFHSTALNREMYYRVFLPTQITPGQHLPVVYLLHGFGDDWRSWSNRSDVAAYAARGLILVMLDGGISYYMNSASRPANRYEDYVLHDLTTDVEARFPAIPARSGRAVIGISMGGFAALKFALARPDVFSFAAALSPPVDILHRPFRIQRWGEWWRIRSIFGPRDSDARRIRDPLALIQSASPTDMPYIYLGAGQREPLLGPIRSVDHQLSERGVAHEFHSQPGGHDWGQWNKQLPLVFDALAQRGFGHQ